MRNRLPNRRGGQNLNFTVAGRLGKGPMTFTALLGYDNFGDLKEVFFQGPKAGSDAQLVMLELGVAFSFALQHGCRVLEMRDNLPRHDDGTAEGPLGTLLDLIAKEEEADAQKELLR